MRVLRILGEDSCLVASLKREGKRERYLAFVCFVEQLG